MNNVQKNIALGSGKPITPAAYKFGKIELENHEGEVYEIQNIVAKFSITESIYSNTLMCKVNIKDTNNLIEDFPIIGQEKLRFSFSKPDSNGDKVKIILEFCITEYPGYGKTTEKYVQAFSLTGISNHAYNSEFKKISRAVEGTTSEIIEDIMVGDLKEENFIIDSQSDARFQGILNYNTPLGCIEWLRKKSFVDDVRSPFYFYQTLDGIIHLKSFSDICSENVHHEYYDAREYDYDVHTDDDFNQRRFRILEITSDLKFSKFFQGMAGAYSSENYYLDIGNKQFTMEEFDGSTISPILNNSKSYSSQKTVIDGTIDKEFQAHCEFTSINAFSFEGIDKNYNEIKKNSEGKLKANLEILDSTTHDIKLFGDLELNAGTIIKLNITRAIDPRERDKTENSQDGEHDKHMSGKYVITSAIHTFENGEYYTNLRVKRDGFNIEV
jgi:hypothetical protein